MANTHSLDLEKDSSQYAQVANDGGITGGNITLECWIKAESNVGQNKAVKQMDAGTDVAYGIVVRDDGGGFGITAIRNKEGVADNAAAYPVTTIGTWHHAVLTYDGTNVKLYTATAGGTHTERASTGSTGNGSAGGTDLMTVGRNYTADQYFDGLVDEFRVWNTVRTTTEMDNNFETELVGNESGLVAYYKLNNDYNDTTANAYHMTAFNSPVFSTTVPFVGGLSIDVNDSITVSESVTAELNLDVNLNDSVTVSESVTVNLTSNIDVNDSITVSEAVTIENLDLGGISVNDAITVSESITTENLSLGDISVNDSIIVSEFVSIDSPFEINVNDSITVSESTTVEVPDLGSISVNDAITVSESVSMSITAPRTGFVNMRSRQQDYPIGMDDRRVL